MTQKPYAGFIVLAALGSWRRFGVYPVFLMKALCFALFACAFNLLLGYTGLLSFGHAAFFRHWRCVMRPATRSRSWGFPPELGIAVRGRSGRAALGWSWWVAGDPPPGHLLRDDHAGAGADGLFFLPAGAVHRRRRRPAGRAARQAVRIADRSDATT